MVGGERVSERHIEMDGDRGRDGGEGEDGRWREDERESE